ncbi:GerMN domain-containing protein, partial [Aetokthonos hydrillicola]|uniref:GerMN domain-containing protein n=1 Tax=Aetokthonos hydrillicola TaxID=1550245 RepID=UPI001ABBC80E
MTQEQESKRISSGVIAAVSAAVVAVSAGVAWFTWNSHDSNVTPNPPQIPNQQPTSKLSPATQPAPNQQTVEIYLLKDTGKSLALVAQPVKVQADADQPKQILEAAFQTLLAEHPDGSNANTIPKRTRLLDLNLKNDGIHVNLSDDFTSGGGSSSMIGRIGQVVYTATSLDKNAKVYIDVNGKRLDILGGEGLELEQPLTRGSFN